MKAMKIQNGNGTYRYMFNDKVIKKASKRDYQYMLIAKPRKDKGATADGEWRGVALGNDKQTIVSSWKRIFFYCDLEVISIGRA